MLSLLLAGPLRAQDQPTLAPTLERIDQETQAIYSAVAPGLVRVSLPSANWMQALSSRDALAEKWKLNPKVRDALENQAGRVTPRQVQAFITSTTQPATQPQNWHMAMVQRPDGTIEFVAPSDAPIDNVIGAIAAPRSLGVIYDDRGHIVLPVYIARESINENELLTVFGVSGGASRARFVGSDRQTNLTILKLEQSIGRIAHFEGHRPADGALVMLLAQNGDNADLAVWTRRQQHDALIVDLRGNVAGFARLGQCLDAELAKPVINRLIEDGRVSRATLGVLVTEAEAPDGRRAMHVDQVRPDSSAQNAGIRQGDYILSIAGNPVDDLPNFAAAISCSEGTTPMEVLRGEKTIQLKVQLRQK